MNTTPQTRQLLAATDFSAGAANAAERAAHLAKALDMPLTLAHVQPFGLAAELEAWLDNGLQWQAQLLKDAAQSLNGEAHRLEQLTGATVRARLLQGHAVKTLGAEASEAQTALMVLGAHGTTTLPSLLLGSTADRLLSKGTAPMLVSRLPARETYRRVLVPVDFSPWSEHAVRLARWLAPAAELVLMHAVGVAFEEKLRFAGVNDTTLDHYRERARADAVQRLEQLRHLSGLPPANVHLCLPEGDAARHVVVEAEQRHCQLIVIGKHGRDAAEELLLGSVTRHVLSQAACDVLVSTQHNARP